MVPVLGHFHLRVGRRTMIGETVIACEKNTKTRGKPRSLFARSPENQSSHWSFLRGGSWTAEAF